MSANFVLDLRNYQKLDLIGEGNYGKVFKIEDRRTHKKYAAKVCNNEQMTENQCTNTEISNLSKINYPTFIHFVGYSQVDFDGNPNPTIVTDYLTNKSLDAMLEDDRKGNAPVDWTPTSRYIILFGISLGMNHLHKIHIVHRDIKPSNILLNENYYPIVCDLGFSKFSATSLSNCLFTSYLGTPFYQAPEVVQGSYDFKVDVYSFSLVVFELMTLARPPFKILNNLGEIDGEENQKFIKRCYSRRPEKRPTFYEICNFIAKKSFVESFGDIEKSEMQSFFEFLEEKESNLDADTLYFIGRFWRENGNESNMNDSAFYMKSSAEKGNVDAMFNYAEMCYNGEGVEVDKVKAREFYKMASDNGHEKARNKYEKMVSRSEGEGHKRHSSSSKKKRKSMLPNTPESQRSPENRNATMFALPSAMRTRNSPGNPMIRRFSPNESPPTNNHSFVNCARFSPTENIQKKNSSPINATRTSMPAESTNEPNPTASVQKEKMKSPPRKNKPKVAHPIMVIDNSGAKPMPKPDDGAPKIDNNSTVLKSADYIVYILNESNKTAEIAYSPKAKGDIFITAFVNFKSDEYKVIGIRSKAFYKTSIKSLSFADISYVESIGASCFSKSTIESFSIPSSLTKFDPEWCDGADNLNQINVDNKNKEFIVINNFMYNKDMNEIIFAPRNFNGVINIPEKTKKILSCSFQHANSIRSLISNASSLKCIHAYAFYECENLEKVSIKSSNLIVMDSSFAFSKKLSSVEFDCKHLSIQRRCFENCMSLNSISFLNLNYISLHSYVFNECKSLTKVDINSQSQIKLEDRSFWGTSSIRSIRLSAQAIEYSSNFEINCNSLTEITLESKSDLVLYQRMFLCSKQLEKVTIKSQATIKMNHFCFNDMQNLKAVEIIGDTVEMESYCFYDCSSLRNFILQSKNAITLDSQYIFNTYKSLTKIELTSLSSLTVDIYFFENATSLTEVCLSGQGLTIKANCFSGCKKLSNFSIKKSGDISIEQNQFIGCDELNEIEIEVQNANNAASQIDFGVDCFTSASSLKKILLSGNNVTAKFQGTDSKQKSFTSVKNENIASFFKE